MAFSQSSADKLDYTFDWKAKSNSHGDDDWLTIDETIGSVSISVPTGLVEESSAITDAGTSVTVWLSGGVVSKAYKVVCTITTTPTGRIHSKSMIIKITQA